MKSFRIDFDEAISHDNVKEAILKPSLGKRNRDDVAEILAELEASIECIQDMLINHGFKPRKHPKNVINENGPHKQREIIKPDYMPEQIVHHVAVSSIKRAVLYGMYPYVLGSIPGRGAHSGKKRIEKWLREDPEHTRVCGKADIHHFFQSIDHEKLRAWIRKKIRPGEIRDLIDIIIDAIDMGLPLGFYTSQWLANFFLQDLDWYIKQELHIKYYTRYMDDIVLFGANKKEMHKAIRAIQEFLAKKGLEMKGDWQVFKFVYEQEELAITCESLRELQELDSVLKIKHKCKMHKGKRKIFIQAKAYERKQKEVDALLARYRGHGERIMMEHGRPLDYMGFLFYRDHTEIRESIMIRATRKAAQIGKSERICWKQASSMLSYMGYITNTDTYGMYLERIKPNVNIKSMKKIVSKHQRRLNKNADHMEKGSRNTAGEAAGS